MKTIKALVLLAAFCLMTSTGFAQITTTDVPKTISYQGAINTQDGAPLADGQYNITVTFYTDANGASKVWQGTYPATVTKGIFNLMLGNGASPFASTSMFNQPLWVGVKVGDGDEMRPLSQLTSAPSALGVADSSITASKMGTNYVAGITVNGTPITGVGSTVNLVGAGSTSLLYDQQTNSIIVNAGATANNGDTANSNGSFKGNGGGDRTLNTNQYVPIWNGLNLTTDSHIEDNGLVKITSAAGGGTDEVTVDPSTGNMGWTGGNDVMLHVSPAVPPTTGYKFTIIGSTSTTTGGPVVIQGGSAGTLTIPGTAGELDLNGGAGNSMTNSNGGNVMIKGGDPTGTGVRGSVQVNGSNWAVDASGNNKISALTSALTTYSANPSTIGANDFTALYSTNGGTIKLPATATAGRIITIKYTNQTAASSCTVDRNGHNIDGAAANITLNTTNGGAAPSGIIVVGDGTDWWIISQK